MGTGGRERHDRGQARGCIDQGTGAPPPGVTFCCLLAVRRRPVERRGLLAAGHFSWWEVYYGLRVAVGVQQPVGSVAGIRLRSLSGVVRLRGMNLATLGGRVLAQKNDPFAARRRGRGSPRGAEGVSWDRNYKRASLNARVKLLPGLAEGGPLAALTRRSQTRAAEPPLNLNQ